MKNSIIITYVLAQMFKLIIVGACIILSGIAIPMLCSILLSSLYNDITFQDCIHTVPFALMTAICTFTAGFYIIAKIEDLKNN